MSNINAHTSAAKNGLPNITPALPALKPWDIADLPLFRFRNGQVIDVEHATPEQFEAWRKQNGIPVKGTVNWTFEMRCKTINYCRFYGVWDALKLPVDFSADTAPDSAELAQDEPEEGA